jgi:CRISPR/Cas system CSM-associated protein Csm4 (group 5 of RAMP superfamily)
MRVRVCVCVCVCVCCMYFRECTHAGAKFSDIEIFFLICGLYTTDENKLFPFTINVLHISSDDFPKKKKEINKTLPLS